MVVENATSCKRSYSASDNYNENRLVKFSIPILPGDNYELSTYENSLIIIATVLNNKILLSISDHRFSDSFYRQVNTIVMPPN